MAKTLYCWRCERDVSMLDEQEWAVIEPQLSEVISKIQRYRQKNEVLLSETLRQDFGREVLMRYRELTGFKESDVQALWHHRSSLYGPPCASCGKPLRSAKASFCAACGAQRD